MDVSFTNVLEGARQYFQGLPSTNSTAGPYFQHQQNAQPRQGADQHHGNPSSGVPAHWPQHNTSTDQNRPLPREHTPVQRTPAASRPSSHPAQYQEAPRQYHTSYPTERQSSVQSSQLGFQFTRPRSQDTPNHQYQPHIVTSSPYHTNEPSQIAQTSSREPIPTSGQSYQQPYQQTAQYNYHQRSYYQSQPKTTTTYTHGQFQNTSQGSFYKQKAFPSPTTVISSQQESSYPNDNSVMQQQPYQNASNSEQTYRTTHNLPPIASLSSYNSSRQPKEQTKVTLPRTRLPSSSSYSHVNPTPTVQQLATKRDAYPTSSNANYTQYRAPASQNQSQVISQVSQVNAAPSQPYCNVIMTMANSSYYTTSTQLQASSQGYYNRPKTTDVPANARPQSHENGNIAISNFNRANVINEPASVIKQKRESPLDLSVKTVRTSADSTDEGVNPHSGSISSHNYPTLDVNTIQRNLTHKSQANAVTAPKVEFQPNFNIPRHSGWVASKIPEETSRSSYEKQAHEYRSLNAYQEPVQQAFHNGHVNIPVHMQVPVKNASTIRPEYSGNSSGIQNAPQQIYDYRDVKRQGDNIPPVIPTKIAKKENWRQSIDYQIEQKFSDHKQQMISLQPRQTSSIPTAVISQGYSEQVYQQSYPKSNVRTSQNPAEIMPINHQYTTKHPQYMYHNIPNRTSSNPALLPMTSRHSAGVGAVDKRVLNLLRNSIEVKEQKKLEQQKSHELIAQCGDIQQPSADVKAPLQPKPGIDRNNVSPIPPTSVQEIKGLTTANTIMNGSSSDIQIDVLQTFLEIRVRTKGELKQLHSENNNSATDAIIQLIIEDPMKSPRKQAIQQNSNCSSTTSGSVSPPKLLKERQSALAPRKRLFSRNEEDAAKNGVPTRDKSGLRSSSETSVFDFPDSDDENEMPVLERQSLEAMRRDRRNSLKPGTGSSLNISELETKTEPLSRPESPEDDIFSSLCETFVEQLKKAPMRRVCRNNDQDNEVTIKTESDIPDPADPDVKIKQEPESEAVIKKEVDVEAHVTPEKQTEIVLTNCVTPVTGNNVKSDSDSDSEIKKDERLAIRNKRRVRRKVLSSSDSSDNEGDNKTELKQMEIKLEQPSEEVEKTPDEQSKTVDDKLDISQEEGKEASVDTTEDSGEPRRKSTDVLSIVRPAKKPLFGDGSDFYPGWEEEVCNYKKSLRMPASLIQITRPPASMRLSTSLPDLDPCPQSPTPSMIADNDNKESLIGKKSIKKFKSEPLDSDSESTSSFNLFGKKTNYDSEGSSSIRSLPNTKMENLSILDRLLEKCGGKKKRKTKRKDDHSPKVVPKAENQVELLATPTPSLDVAQNSPEKSKGIKPPVINAKTAVLPFRAKTVNNFKDAFIHSGSSILAVHDKFTTVVLSSRTRKESQAMKQRATIKEVFGEDRPASAPPVTCMNDVQIKQEIQEVEPFSKNLEEILIKKESEIPLPGKSQDLKKVMKEKLINTDSTNLLKELVTRRVKEEIMDDDDDENKRLIDFIKRDFDARSETTSLDGDDGSVSMKRRSKFGKMRRKLSSGFDYIRKKKKVKKEESENGNGEQRTKKRVVTKTPESIDDIQKEIKSWVLNKGIGETHLHRSARLGYADITAYCLEKMESNPSPKDNAGYTPLHEACIRGHLGIAKLLLQYGASVHESAQGGIRPLHEAVENGFVEIVRLLLSYGADAALATYAGITPISLATDESTKKLLKNHLTDKEGEGGGPWQFNGPASCFDPTESGYNVLDEVPKTDSEPELDDIEIDMSENLPPNLYTLRGEPVTERWVLLQDLSNQLKIKSRDALLRQIAPPAVPSAPVNYKSVLRELKMTDFLEQAHCCQFLNMGEKINTRATKIALVKYTDKVKELLGIETTKIVAR